MIPLFLVPLSTFRPIVIGEFPIVLVAVLYIAVVID